MMKDKNKDTDIKQSEMRRMRDPRSGRLKDVDMSLVALSRTMENIHKSAELINKPQTPIETVMNRFDYIKELVLDHAQFSPRLYNLQVRIMGKTIEVVRHVEQLDDAKIKYAKNYFLTKAEAHLQKGKEGISKAIIELERCKRHIGDDAHLDTLLDHLKKKI